MVGDSPGVADATSLGGPAELTNISQTLTSCSSFKRLEGGERRRRRRGRGGR